MPDLMGYGESGLEQLTGIGQYELVPLIYENNEPGKDSNDEPKWGFLYLGFVGNLCFNFVFQEIAYFNLIFGDSFGTLTNMIYCLADNISLILMIWMGPRLSIRSRISIGAFCLGVIMILIPLIAMSGFKFKMWYGLALVFCLGLTNSIFTSASYALTGICSETARNWQNLGASFPSIIAWPLMVCVNKAFLLFLPQLGDRTDGATTFALLLLAAMLVFGVIPYYIWGLERTRTVQDVLARRSGVETVSDKKPRSMGAVIVATLPLAIALWGVSFLTFIVVPDQVLQWKSSYASWYPGGALGVQSVNIYVFQFCDTIGRFIVNAFPNLLSPRGIVGGSASRLALLPLFFMATGQWFFFSWDLVRIAIGALWGVSYGILVSLAFIHGASQVEKHEGDIAGTIMSFALENGVFMGSCIALCIQSVSRLLITEKTFRSECTIDSALQFVCQPK